MQTINGKLEILHTDNFEGGHAGYSYVLEDDGRFMKLDVSRIAQPLALADTRVRLVGRELGDTFVVARSGPLTSRGATNLFAANVW
jgi:hypothetical protein